MLDLQIQTFKALAENAVFDGAAPTPATAAPGTKSALPASPNVGTSAAININLHIHLPENKSRREYENIIEDIGRYIFGRDAGGGRE